MSVRVMMRTAMRGVPIEVGSIVKWVGRGVASFEDTCTALAFCWAASRWK